MFLMLLLFSRESKDLARRYDLCFVVLKYLTEQKCKHNVDLCILKYAV